MKINQFIKQEWLILLFLIVPFITIGIFWNRIPEQVPMYWNFSGDIENYVPKALGLFLMPGINIIFYLL